MMKNNYDETQNPESSTFLRQNHLHIIHDYLSLLDITHYASNFVNTVI